MLGVGITRTFFLSRLADSSNGDATCKPFSTPPHCGRYHDANNPIGNGFNVFVWSQLECQLSLVAASFPYLQRYVSQYPSVPIVYIYPDGKERIDSVIDSVLSRVSSSLRFTRSTSPRNVDISTPQMVEIPEWEFDTLESPRPVHSPLEEITYDRYVQGRFGPPAPPKDSREIFYQYRREHGEMV